MRLLETDVRIRARRGFTLIELLMVMTLMVIVMSTVAVVFRDIGRGAGMRGAVNSARSTLALARQYAVTKRQDIFVTFTSTADAGGSNAWYIVSNQWGQIVSPQTELPAGVDVSEAKTFHFQSDGTLGSGAMDENIVLRETQGPGNNTITVRAMTGSIKVE